MPTWLEPEKVTAILGDALSEDLDSAALGEAVIAARDYVEARRRDLVVMVEDDDDPDVLVPTFTPTPAVTYGAAMLAYRWYDARGRKGDEVLAEHPEIARQLGIGGHGAFVFGAPADPVEESA